MGWRDFSRGSSNRNSVPKKVQARNQSNRKHFEVIAKLQRLGLHEKAKAYANKFLG